MAQTTQPEQPTSRRTFLKHVGLGAVAGGIVGAGGTALGGGRELKAEEGSGGATVATPAASGAPAEPVDADRVAAVPTDIPPPIRRSTSKHHQVTLEVEEVTAEIESGVTFNYMTFGGQIPGPMIRVRQGDTVDFTLRNPPGSNMAHNVDLHAVYATGGGAEATMSLPGQANGMRFKALYPGAFIYHCAVPNMDWHISSGMFGMILVEPPEGLPEVDHEFYVGQHEIYTDRITGAKGHHGFDFDRMTREDPTYVLLQGGKHALTASRHGPMRVRAGETARVFFVNGGPNLSSHFHPIGNVWAKAWRDGALASDPQRYLQTMVVPPGSCGVFEMEFPVASEVKLVDHALSRVARKGMLGVIQVDGPEQLALFDPKPEGGPG